MTLNITTLGTKGLQVTLIKMTLCHCAECRDLFIVMPGVVMLSVIMMNVVMLSVIMMNVVMLSVV